MNVIILQKICRLILHPVFLILWEVQTLLPIIPQMRKMGWRLFWSHTYWALVLYHGFEQYLPNLCPHQSDGAGVLASTGSLGLGSWGSPA